VIIDRETFHVPASNCDSRLPLDPIVPQVIVQSIPLYAKGDLIMNDRLNALGTLFENQFCYPRIPVATVTIQCGNSEIIRMPDHVGLAGKDEYL
jgi:hypothetical protein